MEGADAAPPFRMIAIVGDAGALDDLAALARAVPAVPIAAMLRDPEHRPERVAELAEHARAVAPPSLPLIANAVAVPGVEWVHLTSAQLRVGTGATDRSRPFGASAHSIGEARAAWQRGARYVTFSPIFPTRSKPGHPGVGVDALRALCASVSIPVFALGGIDGANAGLCIEAGAYGIASISLFAGTALRDVPALFDAVGGPR